MSEPSFKLLSGTQIPALGFGTYEDENHPNLAYKSVKIALEAGYRHLDCAAYYNNEDEIGKAIHEFLEDNHSVSRKDLFITTKVWNHLHEPEDVKWSLKNSLEQLQLDYVDLFLVHWPIAVKRDENRNQLRGPNGKVSVSRGGNCHGADDDNSMSSTNILRSTKK
jgi:diketogulonate reductase-like aldo/keto reductase